MQKLPRFIQVPPRYLIPACPTLAYPTYTPKLPKGTVPTILIIILKDKGKFNNQSKEAEIMKLMYILHVCNKHGSC